MENTVMQRKHRSEVESPWVATEHGWHVMGQNLGSNSERCCRARGVVLATGDATLWGFVSGVNCNSGPTVVQPSSMVEQVTTQKRKEKSL